MLCSTENLWGRYQIVVTDTNTVIASNDNRIGLATALTIDSAMNALPLGGVDFIDTQTGELIQHRDNTPLRQFA
jgi:hypothetical protein